MSHRYLRPTGFVEAPFGHDGKVLRLAGGLCWFSGIEAITRDGRREMIAVGDFAGALEEDERAIVERLVAPRPPLQLGGHALRLDQPQVAGVLNVTPDSFSDYGTDADRVAHGRAMLADGAALIDIGGESTRPGATLVWEGDEIARMLPAVAALAAAGAPLSIDTRKAAVMAAALDVGAGMVNDVSALTWDEDAAALVAARGCPVVLMHHQGSPTTMQIDPRYDDVLLDVYDWLAERIAAAEAAGIDRARIVVDPGIGFGKMLRHNLRLLNGLALFHGLGCAIMVGASRKRTIAALAGDAAPDQRLGGSVALSVLAAAQGVQLLRVHDVFETVQALRVWRGLRDEALTPG